MIAPLHLSEGSLFAGEFRIVRPLSSGGMGAVYVAEQASTGKPRALKLMHPQLVADPKLRERFEQEARVGSLIQSDHVVQVIGAGVDAATGTPWLAMELLEGEDLGAYVRRRGHVSPAELIELFRQLCHALGAAHAVGVVHRDLKPENVFLTVSQSAAAPTSLKVLDFGIAKVVAEAHHTSTATVGTPLWMAPEQTDPRAPITPAADVWSLGLIAFWLLTGKVFWTVAHNPLSSMQAVLKELLLDPIPTASARAGELGCLELLPHGFDPWFAACVARDPNERFANANDARAALRSALPAAAAAPIALAPPASSAPWTNAPTMARTGPAPHQGPTQRSPGVYTPVPAPQTPVPPSMHPMAPQPHMPAAPPMTAPAQAPHPYAAYPYGPTLGATVVPATPKKSSAAPFVVGGLVLVLLGAGGAALGLGAFSTGKEATSPTETPVAPAAPPSPNADPTGKPTTAAGGPAAKPKFGTAAPTGATPAAPGPATAGGAAASPAPSGKAADPLATKKPFDVAAAHAAVQKAGGNAKFHCKGKDGPKAVSATVFFNPSGGVQRVSVNPQVASTPSALCVSMMLGSARTTPFDGPDLGSVNTTVGIE